MIQICSPDEMHKISTKLKQENKKIGFVPTMGFLHEGHLSLIREVKKHADIVILSIFINPKQFGENEDFNQYPQNLENDLTLCKAEDVDYVFTPSKENFYPSNFQTTLSLNKVTKDLCGTSRPTHFDGVTTVVAKLFNVVKADIAIFGQKDFQQCIVIKQMVHDLFIPTEIIIAPIVREADGLAMSSRNKYLNKENRTDALVLNKSLQDAKKFILNGNYNSKSIKEHIEQLINLVPSKIDYIEIRTQNSLEQINTISGDIVISLAVFIGKTRLIDNILLSINKEK
jgi:pantoate--beta-alanine ligase